MRQERPPGRGAGRPVPGPWSGRNPSRLGRLCRANRPKPSFLDDLTTDIRPPIKGIGISRPPFFRALAAEQFLQSEMRNRAPDDDFPVLRFDIETLAVAKPSGLHDLARQPNGQVSSPLANCDLRHSTLHPWDILIILQMLWLSGFFGRKSSRRGYR